MTFTPEQIVALQAPLKSENTRDRKQAGRSLSYIEGWHAIDEANRIFGFDGWQSETIDVKCVAEHERKIGQEGRAGWSVSYIAKVRISVLGALIREGIGAGHGIDASLGLAHESAIKEAETDARKRALITFGNQFGLALYDKDRRNVDDGHNGNGHQSGVTVTSGVGVGKGQLKPSELVSVVATLTTAIQKAVTIQECDEVWEKNKAVIGSLSDAVFAEFQLMDKRHRAHLLKTALARTQA
jgi:DNA recombination protein Rad52